MPLPARCMHLTAEQAANVTATLAVNHTTLVLGRDFFIICIVPDLKQFGYTSHSRVTLAKHIWTVCRL
jgi:hypothetical protein